MSKPQWSVTEQDKRIAQLEAEAKNAGKAWAEKLANETVKKAELRRALQLILEVHPTRNSKEDYVETVRYLAENALKAAK